MSKYDKFVKENKVDFTTRIVDDRVIKSAEECIGIHFGPQLKDYIKKYGYLAYKFAELYGMNSNQNLESDLVKQTKYLHQYYPKTSDMVVVENQGEGDYYLVDAKDNVYEYDVNGGKLIAQNKKLEDYILERFESIQ